MWDGLQNVKAVINLALPSKSSTAAISGHAAAVQRTVEAVAHLT
jgi:hypothetical protein